MRIYVLRHGQTAMNAKNQIMGRTDIPLSAEGRKQAQEAAEKIAAFSKEKLPIIIISSPLIRAKQTAQYVADELEETCGEVIKIRYDDHLIEQDYGELEGTDRLSELFAISKTQFALHTGKTGESHMQLAQRVYNFMDMVCDLYKGQNILLVTHGGICRVIATYFQQMTNEEYATWRATNCQIDEYFIEETD